MAFKFPFRRPKDFDEVARNFDVTDKAVNGLAVAITTEDLTATTAVHTPHIDNGGSAIVIGDLIKGSMGGNAPEICCRDTLNIFSVTWDGTHIHFWIDNSDIAQLP